MLRGPGLIGDEVHTVDPARRRKAISSPPRAGKTVASRAAPWPHGGINPKAVILLALFATAPALAEGDFAKGLAPEEFNAAGLAKLSPEELARLELLIQRYKGLAAPPAVAQPAATEPAPAKTPKGSIVPAWVGALITLQNTGDHPERDQALESRLVGTFNGWTGRSTFRLENGQLWAQANSDAYEYSPTLREPKVKIYPATFGTFWMKIEGVNQRCRVKPVKLQ